MKDRFLVYYSDDGKVLESCSNIFRFYFKGDYNIPEGVVEIGDWAFQGCKMLESVHIPKSVVEIHDCAFQDCIKLQSVHVSDGLKKISDAAFSGCRSLEKISIPEGVESIGDWCFSGCTSLNEIFIPSTVRSIGQSVFEGCPLERISVSPNNKCYDSRDNCNAIICAFDYDDESEEIIRLLEGSATTRIPCGVNVIGTNAFSGRSSLKEINIPSSVNWIDDCAFEGCSSLEKITVSEDNPFFDSRENCNAIIETETNTLIVGCNATKIPESVLAIVEGAFDGLEITEIFIPKGVTKIKQDAFKSCSKIERITVSPDNEYYDSREDCNAIIEKGTNTLIVGCVNTHIPDSVKALGANAFYGCSMLKKIDLPHGLLGIGWGAFVNCTALEELIIPNGVTTGINRDAFRGCYSLKKLSIPDSVDSIDWSAFRDCSSLKQLRLPSKLQKDDRVTIISKGDFNSRMPLKEICIPQGVEIIGEWAFTCFSALETVNLPDGLSEIEDYAFTDCESLKKINIPNSVKRIGGEAFRSCANLQKICIPEGLTEIDFKAFWNCKALKSITIPNSVVRLGEEVFDGCSSLTEIHFANSQVKIELEIVYDGGVDEILLPLGKCVSLQKVFVPKGSKSHFEKMKFGAYKNAVIIEE